MLDAWKAHSSVYGYYRIGLSALDMQRQRGLGLGAAKFAKCLTLRSIVGLHCGSENWTRAICCHLHQNKSFIGNFWQKETSFSCLLTGGVGLKSLI